MAIVQSRWKTVIETDRVFLMACHLAKTPPTQRQASKFYKERGKAFPFRATAIRELRKEGQAKDATV